MKIPIRLEKKSGDTIQNQIYEQIRMRMLTGQFTEGASLPPTRQLAERLGISRNTVSTVYDRLRAEGYIVARGTAGTFVAATLADDKLIVSSPQQTSHSIARPFLLYGGPSNTNSDQNILDFWIGRTDPTLFPIKIWKRLINRCLANENGNLTNYCDPAGLQSLRCAIAEYLMHARGMDVSEDQVLITIGEQEALDLLYRLAGPESLHLCIEDPCYRGAALIFLSGSRPVEAIPVDNDGIIVNRLPAVRRNLLYVSPSRQFPTGAVLPLERRLDLLKWADATDSLIIEDDSYGDFVYDQPPIATLATLNGSKRVLYISSFSQSIGAGVRVGFAVVPEAFSDRAREMKGKMTLGQSWLEQEVIALFIAEGHLKKHLQRLRVHYKARRDCLIKALRENFDNPELVGTESGLYLVWRLPKDGPDANTVQLCARNVDLGVYALSQAASYSFGVGAQENALILSYSLLDEPQIKEAIRRLKNLLLSLSGT